MEVLTLMGPRLGTWSWSRVDSRLLMAWEREYQTASPTGLPPLCSRDFLHSMLPAVRNCHPGNSAKVGVCSSVLALPP